MTAITEARDQMLRRTVWTVGSYGASIILRFGANVVISRLVGPEILGVMVIVNTLKLGIELLTDVGIEQNIVSHKAGLDRQFIDTAWSIQVLRGVLLSVLFLSLSPVFSNIYHVDQTIFIVMAAAPLINSLSSTSIFILVKNLEVKRRNLYELTSDSLSFLFTVILVWLHPNVWTIVIGALGSCVIRSALTYTLPHASHRFTLHKHSAISIISFGKWIAASSLLMYAATNFDRIYLGKVIPLSLLGIYGLAKTVADLPSILSSRVSYQIFFPAMAAVTAGQGGAAHGRNPVLKSLPAYRDLTKIRRRLVSLGSVVTAVGIVWADYAVRLIYDARYREAGWMLCLLLVSSWFSILANFNESILLGSGRPAIGSMSNAIRLFLLAIGIPLGFQLYGLEGAIFGIILSEAARYVALAAWQAKLGISFFAQDAFSSGLLLFTAAILIGIRLAFGLPLSWAHP